MRKKTESLPIPAIYRSANEHRASILILALWACSFLSVIAVIAGYQVRQKISLVQRLEERKKLRFIAEAGAMAAESYWRGYLPTAYDALQDTWSNNEGLFRDIRVGDGSFNLFYEYFDDRLGATLARYGMQDEEGKININRAQVPVLKKLFRNIFNISEMEAQDLAACAVDFRDSDSALSTPLGSAEDAYYRNMPYPYEAKDSDFDMIEELALVKGFTLPMSEKLRNYITVYGSGRVNINTACREVLLALGLRSDLVNKIITVRAGEDGATGTTDDVIFENTAQIIPKLTVLYPLSKADIFQLTRAADQLLSVQSQFFSLRSIARLDKKKATMEVRAFITRSGKILSWREF